jgi:polyferredoxin
MDKKILLQSLMLWFLPVIVIGGLFIPILGYLVFFMMLFFLPFSYFRGRFWCSHLCPRGAFLDLILSKFSLRKKIPKIFLTQKFKWLFFVLFMAFFVFQLIVSPKNIVAIGFVFVKMCLITTIIAIILGVSLRERAWCAMCPMGTLQSKIGSFRKKPVTSNQKQEVGR